VPAERPKMLTPLKYIPVELSLIKENDGKAADPLFAKKILVVVCDSGNNVFPSLSTIATLPDDKTNVGDVEPEMSNFILYAFVPVSFKKT
jgi:hypothetical protein